MLLGKRPRVPMKRTTSMSEITFDLNATVDSAVPPSDPHNQNPFSRQNQPGGVDGLDHQRFLQAMVSPKNHRRTAADFSETTTAPHFLRSCSLCKRRLVPGRDIYMYRGDSAFCSLECRQQQMNRDERMDNCSFASKREGSGSSTAGTAQVPSKGETVAAL
ncbi:hypothetical protein FH972_015922 [Carpinus fangiana]|uniref:FLZ-type domain-containing protein n=1 Tax=Carpinus fangiana TaxID=176857 RepID=A0A5N6RHK3_9ROSI|nr:hypothetical protein FH972_015922 [Carpinus fangiana]